MSTISSIAKMRKVQKFTTRHRNRCNLCGRPRSYYRDFGLCRICLRKLTHNGEIPGVTKSSW
jgi:small subunit ribosomal protein S14